MRRIEKYLDGQEYTELRKLEDEQGVYFVELESVDKDGDKMFVYYKRQGNFGPNMVANESVIEATFTMFGEEVSGATIARWGKDGWEEGKRV